MPEPTPRLLLIDGHAMAFRAYFALPADRFTDGNGEETNAVYGFIQMLFNVIKGEEPTHIAVAFDLPGGTFRTLEYPEYKGGRAPTPPSLPGQIDRIQEVLGALGVRSLTYPDYEADDIIATLARTTSARGGDVLVATSDKDAIQLVDERTTLLRPRKGVTDLIRLDPAAVQETYGVTPGQYPDLAALVGEAADNLPGVPKVGPKTAAKWIAEYGGLEGIIAHAGDIRGKAGENLREHLADVRRNRRLNESVTDLDIPLDLTEYGLGRGSRSEAFALFDQLQFNAVRGRIPAVLLGDDEHAEALAAQLAAEEDARDADATRDVTDSGLADFLSSSAATGAAIVVEGTWALGEADATSLTLAAGDEIVRVDLTRLAEDDERALAAWLADATVPKRTFGAKNDWHYLAGRSLELAGLSMDVPIAEFLCHPDERPKTLADLALVRLGLELEAHSDDGQQELDLTSDADARALIHDGARADAVDRLAGRLLDELDRRDATSLFSDLEMPLVPVLAGMEHAGISVNTENLAELDRQHAAVQSEVADRAYAEIGGDRINLGSPKQLQEVLFDRLQMPPTRRTKTGYSTDAESLAELFVKKPHPFLEAVLEHRDVTKLRQIIETLRKSIGVDGKIHTTFHQNVAATGRLSSNNPNLQNIPARSEEGRRIRAAFGPSAGFETLMTADYSQIEMRIMAHMSEDAGLIEAFRSGEDLHVFVASRVFGVDTSEVTAQMRSRTKAVSYGLAYGLSAFGLARQLGIGQDEATRLRNDYFARFGGVHDYLERSVDVARRTGYTETLLGRRRYLPDLTSDNRRRRDNAERIALNAPIQGSAADIMKLSMLAVDRELARRELRSRVLLQVHDELVLEVAPGESDELRELLEGAMGNAYELSVPLSVSVGEGRTWFEAAH